MHPITAIVCVVFLVIIIIRFGRIFIPMHHEMKDDDKQTPHQPKSSTKQTTECPNIEKIFTHNDEVWEVLRILLPGEKSIPHDTLMTRAEAWGIDEDEHTIRNFLNKYMQGRVGYEIKESFVCPNLRYNEDERWFVTFKQYGSTWIKDWRSENDPIRGHTRFLRRRKCSPDL